ncbi:MAG: hypothetical protein HY040_16395 [Planctomycetes bacterium]|nr:hypothetical protein [Planctomycetota bacterium]
MAFGYGKNWWKRTSGLSNAQRKISRATGVPLSGRKNVKISNPLDWLLGSRSRRPSTPPKSVTGESKRSRSREAVRILSSEELEIRSRRRKKIAKVSAWLVGIGVAGYALILIVTAAVSWIASLPGTVWVSLLGLVLAGGVICGTVVALKKSNVNEDTDSTS